MSELKSSGENGAIYGGLLLDINNSHEGFKPITYPFIGADTTRGNHVKEYEPTAIHKFDYWHSTHEAHRSKLYVAERGISLDGCAVGHDSEAVMRSTLHQIISVNSGVRMEDRDNMLDTMTKFVLPSLKRPAFLSIDMVSSQSKFLLFSRDIPIHLNVFCDDSCWMLVWTNDAAVEERMQETYGQRFVVYRMKPIINSVCVLHTYYLKKKFNRWKFELRDRLKILNALEGMIVRRSKSDTVKV